MPLRSMRTVRSFCAAAWVPRAWLAGCVAVHLVRSRAFGSLRSLVPCLPALTLYCGVLLCACLWCCVRVRFGWVRVGRSVFLWGSLRLLATLLRLVPLGAPPCTVCVSGVPCALCACGFLSLASLSAHWSKCILSALLGRSVFLGFFACGCCLCVERCHCGCAALCGLRVFVRFVVPHLSAALDAGEVMAALFDRKPRCLLDAPVETDVLFFLRDEAGAQGRAQAIDG